MEQLIVFGAEGLIYPTAGAVLLTVALSSKMDTRRTALVLVVSLFLAFALGALASALYSHPQPFAVQGTTPLIPHEVDNAFPSHHTLLAATLAAVVVLRHRVIGGIFFLIAGVIGASRVAAGLHFPIDIVASLLLGALGAYLGSVLVFRVLAMWYHGENQTNE